MLISSIHVARSTRATKCINITLLEELRNRDTKRENPLKMLTLAEVHISTRREANKKSTHLEHLLNQSIIQALIFPPPLQTLQQQNRIPLHIHRRLTNRLHRLTNPHLRRRLGTGKVNGVGVGFDEPAFVRPAAQAEFLGGVQHDVYVWMKCFWKGRFEGQKIWVYGEWKGVVRIAILGLCSQERA